LIGGSQDIVINNVLSICRSEQLFADQCIYFDVLYVLTGDCCGQVLLLVVCFFVCLFLFCS